MQRRLLSTGTLFLWLLIKFTDCLSFNACCKPISFYYLLMRYYVLKELMDNRHIVVFDGACNFCNAAVNFIIKRDPGNKFVFVPMQSDIAHKLMKKYKIHNVGVDTFLLIKDDQCFVFSSAALEIAKELTGCWYIFGILKLVPRVVRDFFYKAFARNRYTLFGRQETCIVPTKEIKSRFIGVE